MATENRRDRFAFATEKRHLAESILLQQQWPRRLLTYFMEGSAYGLGLGIGFSILTTMLLYLLGWLARANLPVIGEYLATIIRLVEQSAHQ